MLIFVIEYKCSKKKATGGNHNELSNNKKYRSFRDEFWDNFFSPAEQHSHNGRMLSTDIEEKEDSYVVNVDVPGAKKEDINVDLENGYLTIGVQEKEEKEDKKYLHHERFFGSYSRTFYLGEVDKENVSASLDNGVLTIVLPKSKPVSNKSRIEIK